MDRSATREDAGMKAFILIEMGSDVFICLASCNNVPRQLLTRRTSNGTVNTLEHMHYLLPSGDWHKMTWILRVLCFQTSPSALLNDRVPPFRNMI